MISVSPAGGRHGLRQAVQAPRLNDPLTHYCLLLLPLLQMVQPVK